MAGDLEMVYAHHRAAGRSEEEAARLAEEKVLASAEVLSRLAAVHAGGFERLLHTALGRGRNELEPFVFLLSVVPMMAIALAVLVPQLGAMGGSPWLWMMLGCTLLIGGLAVGKARQLFGAGTAGSREIRAGLPQILLLGAFAPTLGALGALVHLHALAISLSNGSAPAVVSRVLVEFGRHTALFGASLLLALVAGMIWLFLAGRVTALERSERILLLGE
jgi:hypothetical protein